MRSKRMFKVAQPMRTVQTQQMIVFICSIVTVTAKLNLMITKVYFRNFFGSFYKSQRNSPNVKIAYDSILSRNRVQTDVLFLIAYGIFVLILVRYCKTSGKKFDYKRKIAFYPCSIHTNLHTHTQTVWFIGLLHVERKHKTYFKWIR